MNLFFLKSDYFTINLYVLLSLFDICDEKIIEKKMCHK